MDISVTADDYTLTDKFKLNIRFRTYEDKSFSHDIDIKIKPYTIKNFKKIQSLIPKGSEIIDIGLKTWDNKVRVFYLYYFIFFKRINRLNIDFKNGSTYPIIKINKKNADTRKELFKSKCILF